MPEEPREVAQALRVTQPRHRPAVGDGPELTLPAEDDDTGRGHFCRSLELVATGRHRGAPERRRPVEKRFHPELPCRLGGVPEQVARLLAITRLAASNEHPRVFRLRVCHPRSRPQACVHFERILEVASRVVEP
jgi:hypothetical protein